jgi:hypothetical protein
MTMNCDVMWPLLSARMMANAPGNEPSLDGGGGGGQNPAAGGAGAGGGTGAAAAVAATATPSSTYQERNKNKFKQKTTLVGLANRSNRIKCVA